MNEVMPVSNYAYRNLFEVGLLRKVNHEGLRNKSFRLAKGECVVVAPSFLSGFSVASHSASSERECSLSWQ